MFVRSPYLVIHPLAPPHISVRLFKVAARKEINYAVKVRPLAPCDDCNEYRLCVAQARVTDSQQQSAFSQTMFFLEIFDFYRKDHDYIRHLVWKWHIPAHVCQRWRQVVFASPHRLNLQILCTYGTPVRKNLSIWPAFPIVLDYRYSRRHVTLNDEDDVVATFEHPNRVCYLGLDITGSQLGKMATVMQGPFPVLTHLHIVLKDGNASVLPGEFLGGSAPCLQVIYLRGIPFPTLPSLLLSTSDLVKLHLFNMPPTGYISPEAMVACLALLPSLQNFVIGFQLATSRPDRIHPPPITRTVLPVLTSFEFKGANEYLEDLVARIDSPQLDRIYIDYLNQIVDLQVAQLSKFIDRSVGPELTQFRHAQIGFISGWSTFTMYRHANQPSSDRYSATTVISCKGIDWQVFHMAQVLSQFSAILSNVVHLDLEAALEEDHQIEDDVEWLHLLHQFSTVKVLRVAHELAGHVALALEDITEETVAEALPSLDLIYLEGQKASSIEKFVAVRQLNGRPVIVIDTETEFDERFESYYVSE